MVLRLVLVSVVAGLGVAPPAENELAGWTRSVQTWLDARLAEWDTRETTVPSPLAPVATAPATDLGFELVDEAFFAFFAEQPVANPGPAPSKEKNVEADDTLDPEYEEWMAILASVPVTEKDAGAVQASDAETEDEELKALIAAETSTETPAPSAETITDEDRAFAAVVEAIVADFSQDFAVAPGEPQKTRALPIGLAAEEADEFEAELYDTLDRETALSTATAIVEPLEVGDDLYPGLAYELNREAQGIDDPTTLDREVPVVRPTAGSQLSDAVRLTRDAVFAWINLIQSPAIMTISR